MSLEKIKKYDVYDLNGKLVVELFEEEIAKKRETKVLVSLENIDQNKVILRILEKNIDSFVKGIELIKEIVNPSESIVVIPNGFENLTEILRTRGIFVLNIDFIKPNDYKEYLQFNFCSVISLGEVYSDTYNNQIKIAIKKGDDFHLKVADTNTTFESLVEDEENLIGLKVGYKFYDKSILDETLSLDFDYGDYLVTPITISNCVVEETKKDLVKNSNLSCGNCLFCREGLIHLNLYIDNVTKGKGSFEEMDFVEEIGSAMLNNGLCSIGNKSSLLALTSLNVFYDIYKEHIKDKKCSANICKAFSKIYINPNLCSGCEECIDVCPLSCIDGKKGFIHMIDEFECNSCGKCIEVCDENAILKADGKVPKLPRKLTKAGKFK